MGTSPVSSSCRLGSLVVYPTVALLANFYPKTMIAYPPQLIISHCRFLVPDNTQKILTEIWLHFGLQMMMKSGLEKNIFKFHSGLQRYLLTCQANSAFLGRFFCTGQQQLWRPSWNFKTFFSRPLFVIIFKPKMVSNLRKNYLCIVWHQKPTVSCHISNWEKKTRYLSWRNFKAFTSGILGWLRHI